MTSFPIAMMDSSGFMPGGMKTIPGTFWWIRQRAKGSPLTAFWTSAVAQDL